MKKRILELGVPTDARKFIKEMTPSILRGGTYVIMSGGKKIELSKMTDDEAITVAHAVADMLEQVASTKH